MCQFKQSLQPSNNDLLIVNVIIFIDKHILSDQASFTHITHFNFNPELLCICIKQKKETFLEI